MFWSESLSTTISTSSRTSSLIPNALLIAWTPHSSSFCFSWCICKVFLHSKQFQSVSFSLAFLLKLYIYTLSYRRCSYELFAHHTSVSLLQFQQFDTCMNFGYCTTLHHLGLPTTAHTRQVEQVP
jgi:hypothetical protein